MRVLIWATHLQTDLLALAYHLDAAEDVELLVVMPEPERFLAEPIARARPLRAPILDRGHRASLARARGFAAHVVVADNHLPPRGLSIRLAYLWHGLGWKARPREDVATLHRRVEEITGLSPQGPNPRFLAQCYGEPDRRWRIDQWGLHPASCVVVGMCFSDLLRSPPYDRAALAREYRINVANRPVVLLSVTWHFGGATARRSETRPSLGRHLLSAASGALPGSIARRLASRLGPPPGWEQDRVLLEGLLETARDHGAEVLLCLHERKRYDPAYLAALHDLAGRAGGVQVKHKDEHPDNLADLLVADVMVSNLSSFITYYYVTGRPTVHLHPLADPGERVLRGSLSMGRVRYRPVSPDEPLFMTDPEDNGGLLVRDHASAAEALSRALRDPTVCQDTAADWLARHVAPIDGQACARIERALRTLAEVD